MLIGFLEVFMLVFVVIVVRLLYKLLNRKKYLGKLLFKAQESKSKGYSAVKPNIIFWIFMCCLWVYLLTLQILNIYKYPNRGLYSNIILSVFWIIGSFINILGIIYDKEIRENGIYIRQDGMYRSNVVYWADILSYKWIDDQKLELTFEYRSFFNYKDKTTKVWIIKQEDKEKVDSIFNRYVDKGK